MSFPWYRVMLKTVRGPTTPPDEVESTPWLSVGYLACPSYPGASYRCLGDQLYDLVEFSRYAETRVGTMFYGRRGEGWSKPEHFASGYLPYIAAEGEAVYWALYGADNIPNPSAYWAGAVEPPNWTFGGWLYATTKAAKLLLASLNDASPDDAFAVQQAGTSYVLWPSAQQWRWKVGQFGRRPVR